MTSSSLRSFSRRAIVLPAALAVAFVSGRAEASILDVGLGVGAVHRSLSDTQYVTDFTYQGSVDLGIIPSIFYLGVTGSFARLTPELSTAQTPDPTRFWSGGLRAKVQVPVPGPFKPYGIAGIGFVHTDAPDQTLSVCGPTVDGIPTGCTTKSVPNATANFVELTLGVGFKLALSGEIAFFAEGAWHPDFGYKNDAWEMAAHSVEAGNGSAPAPGRNGYALTGIGGLVITI